MAAPTYTHDLTTIVDCSSNANWGEPGAGGEWDDGGIALSDTDYPFIVGTVAVTQAATKATICSLLYDTTVTAGGPFTLPTDGAYFIWHVFTASGSLDTYANGGSMIMIGHTDADFDVWYVGGNDFGRNPYGGWENQVVNTTVGTDEIIGTPSGVENFIGAGIHNNAAIGKGAPHGIDFMRYGRGSSIFQLGEIANPATFAGFAAVNDESSVGRWGLIQEIAGGYLYKGKMTLGSTSAVYFDDSNTSILIDDTPKVTANFNTIEINNASSTVILTSIGFTSLGTTSPGRFLMNDNATLTVTGCTFTDMGVFTFLSNATVTNGVFRRCGIIDVGNGTYTGCTFDDTREADNPSVQAKTAVYAGSGAEAQKISSSEFISGGTGYGLEVDGAAANFILSDVTWTDYAAQGGTAEDRAIHILADTGSLTITVSGGTTPSYHSEGASVTISDDVVNSVTIRDSAQSLVESCAVAVYLDSDSSELANEFTTATGKVTFSCPVSSAFTIRARKNSSGDTRYFPATQTGNSGAAGVDLTMTLVEDSIAN